ncbi:MAG: HAMP domain-containing protein, partial [Desulfobacterales bacterium]
MRIHSLRSKLLIAVSALVIFSSALVSLLVTQRYSQSIFNTARAQAENLAHTLALEAADKILINDLVGLQKMLDGQMANNSFIAYLFVIRNKSVLAHTFVNGMPIDLIQANTFLRRDFGHTKKIASKQGEIFLDIAWPVFEGKAGVLRMGLSQKPYRQQVMQLRLQMGLLTIGILLVALTAAFLFIQRVTGPIKALAKAAADIAEGDLKIDTLPASQDEVGKLTAAFQHMVKRIQKYTQRLKDQSALVTKAHDEMQVFCGIIKKIGAQNTLDGVGSFLLRELQEILDSHAMVLLVFSRHRDILFRLSAEGTIPIKETQ